MTRQNLLVAFLFAAAAAGIVLVAFEADRRQEVYLAENPSAQAPEPSSASRAPAPPAARERLSDRDYWLRVLTVVNLGLYLWLLIVAFGEGAGWGLAVLLGNGIGALIFLFVHPDKAFKPILLLCVVLGTSYWLAFHFHS